jgi:hypothetical protein
MPQSLVTAFILAEALSERVNRYLGTNRAAIFEAIRNSFRGAVDSDRYATNPCVDHALSQRFYRRSEQTSFSSRSQLASWLYGRSPSKWGQELAERCRGIEGRTRRTLLRVGRACTRAQVAVAIRKHIPLRRTVPGQSSPRVYAPASSLAVDGEFRISVSSSQG